MNADLHSLSGAYALDALDDAERASFEGHLAECDTCREEVASFVAVLPSLASTEEVAPPPALRAQVLDAITTTRQLAPLPARQPGDAGERPSDPTPPSPTKPPGDAVAESPDAAGVGGSAVPGRHASPEPSAGATVTPLRRRRRVLTALAAAAAVAVGGTVAWQVVQPEPTSQLSLADQVLAADDATRVLAPVTGGGRIELVESPSLGRSVLVGHDLPAAPSGHGYQAWLQDGAGDMHADAMLPSDGRAVLLTGDSSSAAGLGLTVEPAGGSTQPTTDPVALVEI